VLSVGSVQPGKGFDFVIQALAELPQSKRPLLRIVGNAEATGERDFLTRLAERLGVALAIEVGLDDVQLARRYAEAALLVFAAHREPFGLVALEAMACATPVVTVAEGGVRESVQHEVTGLLVERQPRLFADAVQRLLADPAARGRLGANAREAVCRQWTWDIGTARLEAELCAASQGGVAPAASGVVG
jgi:glycosyltransferase involved in cell wall biosynthesis